MVMHAKAPATEAWGRLINGGLGPQAPVAEGPSNFAEGPSNFAEGPSNAAEGC
jgi:hypothetical protein